MSEPGITLLDVGTPGNRLHITASPYAALTADEPWFDVNLAVEAHPFNGLIQTVLTQSDLHQFGRQLEGIAVSGRAMLGGDRAVELILEVGPQTGGSSNRHTVEVSLTPSGDDPWPRLAFLVFEVDPQDWPNAAARLLATH